MLRLQFDNVAFFFGNHGEIKFLVTLDPRARSAWNYLGSVNAKCVCKILIWILAVRRELCTAIVDFKKNRCAKRFKNRLRSTTAIYHPLPISFVPYMNNEWYFTVPAFFYDRRLYDRISLRDIIIRRLQVPRVLNYASFKSIK